MNTEKEEIIDLDNETPPDEHILEDGYIINEDPEYVVDNDDGTKTVNLRYPFDVAVIKDGNTSIRRYTSFTFRRPKSSDMEALEKVKSDMNKTRVLFSRLSGAPIAVHAKLDAKDMMTISEAIASFLD